MSDQVKITEEWIKFRGVVYLIWNGELMGTWPEDQAPIAFVKYQAAAWAEVIKSKPKWIGIDTGVEGYGHDRTTPEAAGSAEETATPAGDVESDEERRRAARELHDALKGFV